MDLIVKLLISAVSVFISAHLLPGVHVDDFGVALLVSLVLGLLNAFIKPVLLILTLPITIITFGLFTFVLNALMILLTDKFVSGFQVDSFFWALLLSFVVSLCSSLLSKFTEQQ